MYIIEINIYVIDNDKKNVNCFTEKHVVDHFWQVDEVVDLYKERANNENFNKYLTFGELSVSKRFCSITELEFKIKPATDILEVHHILAYITKSDWRMLTYWTPSYKEKIIETILKDYPEINQI